MQLNGGYCVSAGLRKVVSSAIGLKSSQNAVQSSRVLAVMCKRDLYTKEALGLQGYEAARQKTATQLGSMKDRFKTRMNEYLSGDSKSLIFTEDLKNMLYLAETDSDLQLIDRMMKKYAKQNEQMKFGSFVFGPVLMRMYYHLNKSEEALKAIKDEDAAGLFDQLTSYQLMMDMLYKNKQYDEIVTLFDSMTKRPSFAGRFPKDCLLLAIAACHKLGTAEAYKKAQEMIKTAVDANAPVMRKAVSFAAALALKTGDAAGALEMLTITNNPNYITIRNLKALALTRLGRLEDVLPLMRSVIEQDIGYQKRLLPNFFPDVLAEIKGAVGKKEDPELQHEFEKVFKSIEAGGQVDSNTLEEFLERPIEDQLRRPSEQSAFAGGSSQSQTNPRYQPQSFQPNRDNQFPRQPRYRQDDSFQGQGQGRDRERRSNFNDFPTTYSRSNRADQSQQDGQFSSSRSSREDREYNPNREAGYKPQGQFRQRAYGGRQGLRDADE